MHMGEVAVNGHWCDGERVLAWWMWWFAVVRPVFLQRSCNLSVDQELVVLRWSCERNVFCIQPWKRPQFRRCGSEASCHLLSSCFTTWGNVMQPK